MSYAVNDAVNQVLARLGEVANSPIAQLPTGTGPANAPTITTSAQIIAYLTEAQRELVRAGLVDLYDSGSVALTAGQRKLLFSSLTMATVGRRMYRPASATVNDVAVQVCGREWYEVHNPTIGADANGTTARVYVEEDGVLLAPRPSSTWTIVLYGSCLPKDCTAGQNVDGVPDRLVPAMVEYAVAHVAKAQNTERWDRAAQAAIAEWERLTG